MKADKPWVVFADDFEFSESNCFKTEGNAKAHAEFLAKTAPGSPVFVLKIVKVCCTVVPKPTWEDVPN